MQQLANYYEIHQDLALVFFLVRVVFQNAHKTRNPAGLLERLVSFRRPAGNQKLEFILMDLFQREYNLCFQQD